MPAVPPSAVAPSLGRSVALGAAQDGLAAAQDGLEELLAEARAQADLDRRRGRLRAAESELAELLDEEPEDWRTRAYLARLAYDRSDFERAATESRRARGAGLAELRGKKLVAGDQARRDLVLALETELWIAAERAQAPGDLELEDATAELSGEAGQEPRLEWALSAWLAQLGRREDAAVHRARAAAAEGTDAWDALASARAHRAGGDLTAASYSLTRGVQRAGAEEPELLSELASIYFEADGEVADERTASRNPGPLYKRALELDPTERTALLGLFELYRFNWRRQSVSAWDYLDDLFDTRPDDVGALLAAATAELEVGRLPDVRARLERLRELAPARRELRSLEAALAWVEHRRDASRATLDELHAQDPADSAPQRTVGELLIELYRFSEALEFLRGAVERAPGDYRAWAALGRALANTGDVPGALEALARARKESGGRRDVFAENLAVVLDAIRSEFTELEAGDLTFAWSPTGADVIARYMVPFYSDARVDLARRYGYTSGPVRIEVFDRHRDFSVRSTGFEGFPALGVCFGPVVTAVSPLSDLRGSFSWARTAYHEFTHVVHLGLSNNRCPRWITEGLATWEEVERNPAWTRNMRRDLLDARANGDVIPLRELNETFRGPRILFGYYQGGLLCEMLIERAGFPSMIRLLEAFDRGDDLDQAFRNVFDLSPEEVDELFGAHVDELIGDLRIEPLWRPARTAALRFSLQREPPADDAERRAWREDWATVAHGAFQRGSRVDAEEALRLASLGTGGDGDPEVPRAVLLRGQMAVQAEDDAAAEQHFTRFLELGGEDFRARLVLAQIALGSGAGEAGEEHLLAAERAFPGYPQEDLAAELALVRLYDTQGREDDAMAARERWLAFNADDFGKLLEVARWHAANGRHAEAVERFAMANDIDPFRIALHREWAASLQERALEIPERADEFAEQVIRELRVALAVPAELDPDADAELTPAEQAEMWVDVGELELHLGRPGQAAAAAASALEEQPDDAGAQDLAARAEAAQNR